MSILVTGGAGFIGSNLVYRLLSEKHRVVVLDNFYTGRQENLDPCKDHPGLTVIRHDVVDPLIGAGSPPLLQEIDCDQIYHLACPASPVHYQKDPIHTLKTSIWGMVQVMEFALAKKARMVFSSTSEVYGDPLEHPQRESYWGHVNPIGVRACYDEGKRVAETLGFDYHRQRDLNLGVVRIFNTYGKNMFPEDGRVVSNFIVQCLQGKDLTVYGEGDQTRSFCYVDDIVTGLIAMMGSGLLGPINLGNPNEMTVKKLAETVIEMTGTSSRIIHHPLPPDDPGKRRPDITQAQQKLGWEPHIDLREGLGQTIEYFKARVSPSLQKG